MGTMMNIVFGIDTDCSTVDEHKRYIASYVFYSWISSFKFNYEIYAS